MAAALRRNAVRGEKAVIGLRRRLRLELGGDDIEHILETLMHGKPPHHRIGVFARAVGEDQLAAGQLFQRRAQRRIGLDRRMVDLMHDFQIIIGLHAVLDHQSAHRGAVAPVIVFLQTERLVLGDFRNSAI